MVTPHVQGVPDELYERLEARVRARGRSVDAEALRILTQMLGGSHVSQRELLDRIAAEPTFDPIAAGAPTSTELFREDRAR